MPQNLDVRQITRAMTCSEKVVFGWLKEFEAFCVKFNITSPSQVFNISKTGCPFQPKCMEKIIVVNGIQNPHHVVSSLKEQITTLAFIAADGCFLPPCHIYPGKRINPAWRIDAVPEAYFGVSDNGWMETELMYGLLANRFLNQIPPRRPVLILLDGHFSYIDLYINEFSAANGIHVFCLPPHASRVPQALDVGFLKEELLMSSKKFIFLNVVCLFPFYNF